MPPVSDMRDVRVMIPATRRAIDGPTATGSAAISTTLDDDQVHSLIADSLGDVILLSGGVFGKTLEVTARDDYYQAPTEWRTSSELSDAEQRVIVAQAALNYYFLTVKTIKTSETISDEGQSWDYTLSAQLLRDQLKALIDMRDKAIEALGAASSAVERWVDFVHERDQVAWAMLEPFSHFGGVGGQIADPRGFF